MELKLACGCGQNYKFDVEPVNGLMPFVVNCPTCGVDGTSQANASLAQLSPVVATPPPPTGLRISRAEPPPSPATPPPPPAYIPAPLSAPRPPARVAVSGEFNMGKGVLGAFLGAAIGAGLMIGFTILTGIRFPFLGIGIGALTGYGGKLLYKGTSNSLGIVACVLAAVAVTGTLFFIYGSFPLLSIISVVVSLSVSYRIATGS